MLGKNELYNHDLTNFNQINNHRPATQGDNFSSINNQSSSSESKNGKCLSISVQFLDDSVTVFKIPSKALGKWLFAQVCETLNLIEVDYFGLEYFDSNGTGYWLDSQKPIYRQLSLNLSNPKMYFGLKFYTPEPSKLEDELTRYLFSLQIKKDLANGVLQCNENTAALIASYIVQAEIGDFNSEEYSDFNYVSKFKLIPHQTTSFEWKVMENHKNHIGQSPSEADMNLIETARRCEFYGTKMTPVKDLEGVPFNLAVIHSGIMVYQNMTKVNSFVWSKIRKLSFKRKRFLIKLHQEEQFGQVGEFLFNSRNECKSFWKKCIEQHTFFKCNEVKNVPVAKNKFFTRGSSFRYSGRTQKQVSEYYHQQSGKRTTFQRCNSLQIPKRNAIERPFVSRLQQKNSSTFLGPMKNNSFIDTARRSESAVEYSQTDSRDYSFPSPSSYAQNNNNDQYQISKISQIRETKLTSTNTVNDNSIYSHYGISNLRSLVNQVPIYESIIKAPEVLDISHQVLNELVMLEKSFKKDFEIICIWSEEELFKLKPIPALDSLLSFSKPLLQLHQMYLNHLENLLISYKSQDNLVLVFNNMIESVLNMIPQYVSLIHHLPSIIDRLSSGFKYDKDFKNICRDFEAKKGCYLPFTSFLLKPIFHLTHYQSNFERFLNCSMTKITNEYQNCQGYLRPLLQFNEDYSNLIDSLLKLVVLIELHRDISGLDNFPQNGRTFLRQGCLFKCSKKGYQQRIFFLFSDMLIYCSRSSSSQHKFKVNGFLPLVNVLVEETEAKSPGVNYCFTVFGGDRAVMVSANNDDERKIWMKDIIAASYNHGKRSRPNSSISEEVLERIDRILAENDTESVKTESSSNRSNSLYNVCWHRNSSISIYDFKSVYTHCMSGILLRKFKSSSGWQKLWVVYTHFCLLFYKSSEDNFPLASLPLLGYTLSLPSEEEKMKKGNIFKLSFKAHIYFFRAENDYLFKRWLETIGTSTHVNI